MKFSNILTLFAWSLSLFILPSYAEGPIKGPIVRHEQLNPGLDVQVNVVPMRKYKSEVTYTVTKLPRHGTLYYEGVKIEAPGFILSDPNKVTIDPEDGNVTIVAEYTATHRNGEVSVPRNIIMRFLDLQISGSVFYDFEGNGIIDGKHISNLNGEPLYITLINKDQQILASKVVSAEGTYSFSNVDGIQPNTNYALVISTEKNSLTSVLPEKWGSSGENINSLNKGKDIHSDGAIVVKLREKSIKDVDFGLDVRPLAKTIKQEVQLNPGGDEQVVVPKLEGHDKEDAKRVRYYILTLPENATLYEKGKALKKAGVQIKTPERLTVDPDNSDQNVTFTYVTVDTAGVTSYPATVEMPFSGLKISGNIYNDGNGDGVVNGEAVSSIEGEALYVTLLNDRGIVLASVSPDSNGSFVFDGTQGVVPESRYTLVLSTKAETRTSTLPLNWSSSGEGIISGKKKIDNVKDGKINVELSTKDVHNIAFAVNKKPEAEDIVVEDQLNPGFAAQVAVPVLLGSDHEDPKGLVYTIESLPENAGLYSAGKKVKKVPFVVADPSKITLDPKPGEQKVSFTYKVTDAEGIGSEVASVKMSFSQLRLSGHLFNDGNADDNVSGPLLYRADHQQIFVLLLNAEKKLLAAKPVEKNGTYMFDGKDGVDPQNTYVIALATDANADAFGLPEGWNSTGEKINTPGMSKDQFDNAVIAVKVENKDVSNIDFGINKKPVADTIEAKAKLNPGLDTQAPVPMLRGKDRESGTDLIYTITSLPTEGRLYDGGIEIRQNGYIVKERDKLTLDPKNGDRTILFTYTVKDKAGVSSDPAEVKMIFKGLHIRGRIVNDGSGESQVKGKLVRIPARLKPYATLLDDNNTILASNPLKRDGSFDFSGNDGVRPYANFTIVLSLEANSTISVLPSGWAESGEGLYGKDSTKDRNKDGRLTVYMSDRDINTLTFGVNQKPKADPKNVKSQINPGGTVSVPVPKLSGNDRESGTHLKYRITKLPDNARLYSREQEVAKNDLVDPGTLSLDPKDGKQVVVFEYVSVDPEGLFSEPVSVRMRFSGLNISGHIFEDFELDGVVDSATTVAADQIKLFVTLLSEKGELLASVPVQKDGSYLLNASTGVNANTKYRLVLGKDANMTKSVLPQGWHYADGENVNSLGKGTDGKADGMIDVWVKETDLKQVDFGINYLLQ